MIKKSEIPPQGSTFALLVTDSFFLFLSCLRLSLICDLSDAGFFSDDTASASDNPARMSG